MAALSAPRAHWETIAAIVPPVVSMTTEYCLSGVIRPDRGSIYFETHSLTYAPPHLRARLMACGWNGEEGPRE